MAIIEKDDIGAFLKEMPIEQFRGVGKKTIPKMHELGVFKGADLLKLSENDLIHHFGKFGYTLYRRVRGQDDHPVAYQRERKSIGKEETYGKPLVTENEVDQRLRLIAKKLAQAVTKRQKHGKTLVLKLRYSDFETLTKRITRPEFYQPIVRLTTFMLSRFLTRLLIFRVGFVCWESPLPTFLIRVSKKFLYRCLSMRTDFMVCLNTRVNRLSRGRLS